MAKVIDITVRIAYEQDNILLDANGGTHDCRLCSYAPKSSDCPHFCPSRNEEDAPKA